MVWGETYVNSLINVVKFMLLEDWIKITYGPGIECMIKHVTLT